MSILFRPSEHLFQPPDLGLDKERFPEWREQQYEVINDMVSCETPCSGHCAPTGIGKSLCAVGYSIYTDSRTLILTSFKGLQDQYTETDSRIADVRGSNNYWCEDLRVTCEKGSPRCESRRGEMGCLLCPRKAAVANAIASQIVCTNYSCWFHQLYGQGFGKFDAIICDEADQAISELSEFLAFTLNGKEALYDLRMKKAPHWDDGLHHWVEWAGYVLPELRYIFHQYEEEAKQTDNKETLEKFFHYRSLYRKINTLASIHTGNWVSETTREGIRFDPVCPGDFAEGILFRGIPRRILLSATLNKKTYALLGVKEYTHYEYESVFPIVRAPLTLLPVGNFSHRSLTSNPGIIDQACRVIDKLSYDRQDRKGIFHTISFRHLQQFMERTTRPDILLTNDRAARTKTTDVVEMFKQSPPPTLLASPSLGVGWDFKYDYCRYSIILKVPYPDTTSLVSKARKNMDPEYLDYLAATYLMQSLGRAMRAKDDWSETIILDTRAGWFVAKNTHLFTKWFLGNKNIGYRFRKLNAGVVPEPMR